MKKKLVRTIAAALFLMSVFPGCILHRQKPDGSVQLLNASEMPTVPAIYLVILFTFLVVAVCGFLAAVVIRDETIKPDKSAVESERPTEDRWGLRKENGRETIIINHGQRRVIAALASLIATIVVLLLVG